MKKQVLSRLVLAASVAGLVGCKKDNSKVVNIYCWNNEFENRISDYYPGLVRDENGAPKKDKDGAYLLKSGNRIKYTQIANENNAYQNALDAALNNQESAKADDKVDIFLREADYALKYANSDITLDVKKDVGLTDSDLSDRYDYTKVIATDTREGKGKALKGVSWQATPGLFAYRTDIAEEVLGTSDPDQVQSKIDTWDKFNAVAAQRKEKSHYRLSGYDDSYRTFSNNRSTSWVKGYDKDGKRIVTLDPRIKSWIKQTADYTTNAYSHKTKLWDADWKKDQGPEGNVFGFFYSTWGINFTLKDNALAKATSDGGKYEVGNGLYGKYRVVRGPANYYWGGTWICAAKGTDNIEDVKDIRKMMTCDKDVAETITRGTEDYTNNKTARHKLATDPTYKSDFLGGQNHIALFEQTAAQIKRNARSDIDQTCNEGIQNARHDYFANPTETKYQEAINNFKATVTTKTNGVVFDETFASL